MAGTFTFWHRRRRRQPRGRNGTARIVARTVVSASAAFAAAAAASGPPLRLLPRCLAARTSAFTALGAAQPLKTARSLSSSGRGRLQVAHAKGGGDDRQDTPLRTLLLDEGERVVHDHDHDRGQSWTGAEVGHHEHQNHGRKVGRRRRREAQERLAHYAAKSGFNKVIAGVAGVFAWVKSGSEGEETRSDDEERREKTREAVEPAKVEPAAADVDGETDDARGESGGPFAALNAIADGIRLAFTGAAKSASETTESAAGAAGSAAEAAAEAAVKTAEAASLAASAAVASVGAVAAGATSPADGDPVSGEQPTAASEEQPQEAEEEEEVKVEEQREEGEQTEQGEQRDAAAVEDVNTIEAMDVSTASSSSAGDEPDVETEPSATMVAPSEQEATAEAVVEVVQEEHSVPEAIQEEQMQEESEEEREAEQAAEEDGDDWEMAEPQEVEEPPTPTAPGMSDANLIVGCKVDPVRARSEKQKTGVDALMRQRKGTILGLMAREGWDVKPLDEAKGLFELKMPSVRYELPVGAVSIPQPRFVANVYDSFRKDEDYQERLIGDIVLQNGQDILTVEQRLPFMPVKEYKISAAGWARCRIGGEGGDVRMEVDVEIGMFLPKVPGLTSIMDFFVRSYSAQSAKDCTEALSKGADLLVEQGEA